MQKQLIPPASLHCCGQASVQAQVGLAAHAPFTSTHCLDTTKVSLLTQT
jgi:hypothetical protein